MKSIEADSNRYSFGEGTAKDDAALNIWVPPVLDFTAPLLHSSLEGDLDLSNSIPSISDTSQVDGLVETGIGKPTRRTDVLEANAMDVGEAGFAHIPESPIHLVGMNQPKLSHDSDAESLGADSLFDERKERPAKPLLAAAKAAVAAGQGKDETRADSSKTEPNADVIVSTMISKRAGSSSSKSSHSSKGASTSTNSSSTSSRSSSGASSGTKSSSSSSSGSSSRKFKRTTAARTANAMGTREGSAKQPRNGSNSSRSQSSSRALDKTDGEKRDSFLPGSNIPTFESVMKSIEADSNRYSFGEGTAKDDAALNIWVPPVLDFTAPLLHSSLEGDLDLSNSIPSSPNTSQVEGMFATGIGHQRSISKSSSSSNSSLAKSSKITKQKEFRNSKSQQEKEGDKASSENQQMATNYRSSNEQHQKSSLSSHSRSSSRRSRRKTENDIRMIEEPVQRRISNRGTDDNFSLSGKGIEAAYERLRSWDEAPVFHEKPEPNVPDNDFRQSRMWMSRSSWAAPILDWNPFSHIRRVAPNDNCSHPRPDPPDETPSVGTGENVVKVNQRHAPDYRITYYFDSSDDISVNSTWAPPTFLTQSALTKAPPRLPPKTEIDASSRSSSSRSIWAPPGKASVNKKPDKADLSAAWYRSSSAQRPPLSQPAKSSASTTSVQDVKLESAAHVPRWSSPVLQTVTTQAIPDYLDKPSIFEQMENGEGFPAPFVVESVSLLDGVDEQRISETESKGETESKSTTSSSTSNTSSSKDLSLPVVESASSSDSLDIEHGIQTSLPESLPAVKSQETLAHEAETKTQDKRTAKPAKLIPTSVPESRKSQLPTREKESNSLVQDHYVDLEQGKVDEIDEEPKGRKWECWCKVLFFVVLLAAGATAAAFIFTGDNKEPTSAPTLPSSTLPPTATGDVVSIITGALDGVGGSGPLGDPNSPQSRALDWIQGNENLDTYPATRVVQRYVMASLYYSTIGDSWVANEGWLTDKDECEWYTSSTEKPVCTIDGSLDVMNLKANNLTGRIPWVDLSTLSAQLVEVDFLNNSVSGSLPTQMGLLTKLTSLNMFDNQVTGTLPPELGGMTRLQYLDLESNSLKGSIPSAISGMASLETLRLSNNEITGTVPTELGLMSNLQSLDLQSTLVTGTMPREICVLPQLKEIEATCTDNFKCDCCTNSECNSSSSDPLRDLIASKSPDGGKSLDDPNSPQSMALQWLKSPLNSDFKEDDRLIQRYALATLYYSTAGEGWTSNFLWLSSSDECIWYSTSKSGTICDQDGKLRELDIQENKLFGSIPQEVVMLSESLQILRLTKNSLSGTIPSILHELSILEHLDLSANSLGGALPGDLGLFGASLTHLTFFNNDIGSTIPAELGQLTSLQVLDVGSNILTGTIPTQIGLMRGLAGLSFYDNRLTGSVPCEIHALDRLELFYIDSNSLGPSICDQICQMQFTEFWADCSEVECQCCTTCCTDNFGCSS